MVGDHDESEYEEFCFTFFSPVEMPGEPATLKEAFESSDAEEWKKAMESELKSFEENGTWELVELPEGCKAITSKWLFKIKSYADGKIERNKSRLVAKGYQQKKKVDYKGILALRSCQERLDAGHQAWHFILSTYQVRDDLYIAQMEEKTTQIRMGKQESATDYCNRARRILAQMRMAGAEYSTASYISHIVKGLPRGYNLMKRMMMVPGTREFLDENSITSYILQDEAMQEAKQPTELLPQGRGGGGRRRDCWICHYPDHLSYECPDRNDSDEDDTKGGRGRSTSRRPRRDAKLRKEKQMSKKTSSTKDVDNSSGKSPGDGEASCSMVGVVEPTVLLAPEAGEDFQAVASAVQANPMAVLLDSSCSHHQMGTKAVFVDMAPSDGVKHVRGFNGALQHVEGRGTVALQGEAGKRVLIPHVLYVLSIQANLLSAGRLKESGVQLQGDGNEMLLVAATGEVLNQARYNGRVLCTDLRHCSTRSSPTKVVALRMKSTPDRLHARLAHVSIDTIKSSAKHKVANGLDITSSTAADPPCVSCVGGKLAQHTFPAKGSDAEETLAVLHIDLCGPFRVAAKDGSLYFLLLKDRHTRFVATRSQWLTRNAAASLVIRNHLPLAECAHIGQHRTAHALYDAAVARYSSPATAALGRLLLPYLFPKLSAFTMVEDLVSHLRTSDARYRATVPAEFLDRNQPPMFITLYFIVTRLPDSLRSVRDHFLSLDPTSLTVDLLEQHLLAAETSAVAVGAARGTPRPPFFEGCSPSPIAPSYASPAAADVPGAEDVGAASASAKRRSGKGKGSKGVRGVVGAAVEVVEAVAVVAAVGVVAGVGVLVAAVEAAVGVAAVAAVGLVAVGLALGVEVLEVASVSSSSVGARPSRPSSFLHTQHRCFSCLDVAWRAEFGEDIELPHWADLLRSRIAIFDLDFDAILSAMYALSVSAEGHCYRCVPPDPGIAAAALGASELCTLPGTALAQALHTFTLDSSASRCFFRDSTTLTPLPAPVPARLADPFGGPIVARSSTVLSCLAVPSSSLSGLHLPLFSTNLVSTAALQDAMVTTTTPGGQRVSICTCTRTGRHLATFTRRLGSSLYTLTTEPPPVAASALLSAPGQSRERYFLLVVDDYMRYTTAFPLRSKVQVVDVLIPWIRTVRLQLYERFGQDLPIPRLHSDRGGEFSSNLLRDFCRGEGILQSFTLPDSPQQIGIAERRIGLVMEVARTSMIHAAAPHFLWPFAVQYAAHQLNLWPRVSLLETSPTLRWTGKVGDASVFRVWGSRAFVRDPSADKLFARAIPCVFLGFVSDGPGWQFYHPTLRRVLPSQDVTFDETVPFYRLFPYRSAPLPPLPLFLAPGPPPVDPLPPQGPAPSGVSQVDPPPGAVPGEVAVDSGAARGTASGSAELGGAEPGGAESGGAELGGVGTGGAEPWGAKSEGVEPGGAALNGAILESGATGAGGAGVAARAGVSRGTAATGPGGARTRGTGAAGTGGVEGAGAGDPTESGAACTSGSGAGGAGAGGAGVGGSGAGGTGVGGTGGGGARAVDPGGAVQPQPHSRRYSQPLHCLLLLLTLSSPAVLQSVVSLRLVLSRLFAPGTHAMTLRPSSVPLRVPLLAAPESSLPKVPDPESDCAHAASLFVSRLLATTAIDPSFESTAASALVAKLLDIAAACRLDYASTLVAESTSASPPFVRSECALGTDVLEDRQEDFECLAAAAPRFASMLFAPEGDPGAPDITTPRSYAEAITGPYSSQCQAAIDAEMAFWKSTGTYVDEVPPPGANIVDGMWIFRVERPPGSPPAFKARYVARGFSQRQGVDYFQTFSPTPKMTTLRWSLRRPVYGLRQAPRKWHDTLRTTLAALGFAPSSSDPSLFLSTETSLPPLYVLVYVDDLVFATANTGALTLVKSELQKRHTCTDLGPSALWFPVLLATAHFFVHQPLALSSTFGRVLHQAWGSYLEEEVQLSSPVTQTLPGSRCEAEIYAGAMAAQELRWLTYLLIDLEEQPRSLPILYQRGQLRLAYVANTADIFTKALPPGDHQRFSTVLGLLALVFLTGLAKNSVLLLRSDQGGEFLGKDFTDFVDTKGIVHDLTCPYTPQQNGMAEREMRTAVESVRTMLLHMGVQHHYWHLALRQAVWVRNYLEWSTTPPGMTPYQLMTGKKLDLSLVWGRMVQFMVLEQQRSGKLGPKARWGLHLGVSLESKGWEVLDLNDNKVVTSVEVIFYETLSLELAEVNEFADEDVTEVLSPPPDLAPPFPIAYRPASTPVSATGDEGSLEASPVAPTSGIAGGQQGAKLVDQDGKLSTTWEQQTGEPVEQEAAAGVQSTGELPKSAGSEQLVEGSMQLVDELIVDEEGELLAGEESTDSDMVEVPITKPELRRTGRA
ncbi:unnamed protein product [Closterium sp. NIES-53]